MYSKLWVFQLWVITAIGSESRERIGLPLLSDIQNCASPQGASSKILGTPHSPTPPHPRNRTRPPLLTSHAQVPLVGTENLLFLGVPILHWQLPGEGNGLAEIGAVFTLMEFHRLNFGFLAHRGLKGRRD